MEQLSGFPMSPTWRTRRRICVPRATWTEGEAVVLVIFRQPGANIIQTVDRVKAQLPFLEAVMPQGIKTTVVLDRTTTIRASVNTVEKTLVGSVCLVILVVFVFLRSPRATLIPSVAVPVSLIGTFAMMYLLGYTLDNLSLMALTIATGFVVDDAIVVMENITRHLEAGMEPFAAALQGAREIGFTVFSISMSLIAVFIPILMMGGIIGRLFREFAVTLVDGHSDFDGHFAHNDALHVRARAESTQRRRKAQLALPCQRKDVRRHDLHLPAFAAVGAG